MSVRRIAVLAGDGIGPEVMQEAIKALDKIGSLFGHSFDYNHGLIGGAAYDEFGNHFPEVMTMSNSNEYIVFYCSPQVFFSFMTLWFTSKLLFRTRLTSVRVLKQCCLVQ